MKGAIYFLLLVVYLTVARDFERGVAYGKRGYGITVEPEQPSWMSQLANDRRLFVDVTIPGTQSSASYTYNGLPSLQFQSVGITRQLRAGVRFLDIDLVFIYGVLSVSHELHLFYRVVPFDVVLSEIQTFLQVYPTEVVIARLMRHFPLDDNTIYTWNQSKVDSTLEKFKDIFDTACKDSECTINPSRGKLIFLEAGSVAPSRGFLRYEQIMTFEQDMFNLATNLDLYEKWGQARNLLMYASTYQRTSGVINYFSASGGVYPYFVASGATGIDGGTSLSTGILKNCKDMDWELFLDFPRDDCTGCGVDTTCEIYYLGMNYMLYDWLLNGLEGKPQSKAVAYVWPWNLGILVLAFPDNALLNKIIAVNFQTSNPWGGGNVKLDGKCFEKTCPPASCVAGDVKIATDSRGVVAARDVVVGDRVPGAQDGEWCEVVAAVHTNSKGTVYGNFTYDHLVAMAVEPTDASSPSYTVKSNGVDTPARQVDLVNIATTCPVVRAAGGELFTPLSTVFCTELTWDQYIPLYAAIMRVVAKTGAFWFDPSTYTFARDTDASPNSLSFSKNPRDGMSELPGICGAMLPCAINGTNCDEFERLMAVWVQQNLPPARYKQFKEIYPNLGNPDAKHGNLFEDVRPPRQRLIPVIIDVLVVTVACLATAAVVFALCRWRKRLPPKEVTNSESMGAAVSHIESQSERRNFPLPNPFVSGKSAHPRFYVAAIIFFLFCQPAKAMIVSYLITIMQMVF